MAPSSILLISSGMYNYWLHLSNSLCNHLDVHILVPENFRDTIFYRHIDKRVMVHYFKKEKFWSAKSIFSIRNLIKQILEINPDIIHFPGSKPVWSPILYFLLKLKFPLVFTIHEPVNKSFFWYENVIISLEFLFGDCIIVTSKLARHETIQKRHVDEAKIFSIPLGPFTIYPKMASKTLPEESNTVLMFGLMSVTKGVECLIEAEKQVSKEIQDFKVIMAGKFVYYDYKALLASPHFEIYDYFIPEDEVGLYFSRASVVVLPYIQSTQSGNLSTAYAFCKPVIVTDVGSLPEVVENGKTGIIVPPRDVNVLSKAIIQLLKNEPLRIEMKKNIANRIKTDFSWNKLAKNTVGVYRQAIKCKGAMINQ